MSHYLVLSFVDVQGANSIAGFTWGFPAVTQFLGFTHALERKCNAQFPEVYKIKTLGCAVVANATEQRVFKNRQNFEFLQSKRTPTFAKDKSSSPPIIEEGKMNMTISLIIELEGQLPVTEEAIRQFEQDLLDLCYSMRLAGGTILHIKRLKLIAARVNQQVSKLLRTIKALVMPGFVLKERKEYLVEHHNKLIEENPDADALDALLDFAALKFQAEKDDQDSNKAQWHYVPKPQKGYLVPLTVGYKAISELYEAGEVANVRDTTVPARFVEAIHTVGEWQGAHRIQNMANYIWRYQYFDEHWYLCQQQEIQPSEVARDEAEEITNEEELTLNQALELLL